MNTLRESLCIIDTSYVIRGPHAIQLFFCSAHEMNSGNYSFQQNFVPLARLCIFSFKFNYCVRAVNALSLLGEKTDAVSIMYTTKLYCNQ
jgi:hypothetical protein